MDRSDLGAFGAGLAEGELAQALAAQGVLAQAGAVAWQPVEVDDTLAGLAQALHDGFAEVASWWLPPGAEIAHDPAPRLAEAWRRLLARSPAPRLEVQGGDASAGAAAAQWLARSLRHPAVGAASVVLRADEPAWPVVWQWPLRLGVLAGMPRTARLHAALTSVPHARLWTVVDMEAPGAECELLLVPGDLRQALADVLAAPQRPRSDAVLVFGSTRMSDARAMALATALRREARTAGVALLPAGLDAARLLGELVAELSHDATLDVALFRALRTLQPDSLAALDLVFSRTLTTHSSVRLAAARVVRQFAPAARALPLGPGGLRPGATLQAPAAAAPPLAAAERADAAADSAVEMLQEHVERGGWSSERGEASDFVHARETIARSTRQRHRAAPVSAALPPPPPPLQQQDAREVLAKVLEQDGGTPSDAARPGRAYLLRVKIALPQAGFTAAGTAFPSQLLPPSEAGHTLDVSFVPLVAPQGEPRPAPQQRTVFLPPQGDSSEAGFVFHTHGLSEGFRARLLVSHANRVIQSLQLQGTFDAAWSLAVENLVQPGFQNLAYQAPFDAALVLNHAPQGEAGVTLLAGSSVSFVQPAGLDAMLERLSATLTDETALRRAESSFEAEALGDLLYALMQHGRLLYDCLEAELGALDQGAGRIQVVETRASGYFPLEFLYPLEVPPARPPMCPQAAQALTGEASHAACPHRDDPETLCPLRFWGFRKQIERQPPGALAAGAPAPALSVPTPLQGRLDLFRAAEVARSCRVQPADFDLPEGLLKVLNDSFGSVTSATSWRQWKGAVAEQSPGFLLLLAHTAEDERSHLPALEINQDLLPVASLEAGYVKGPQASAPVVFLFGCSTADPKLGFLNFVERFKRKQAALVVGTLSTISAQRAARFLGPALRQLKDPAQQGRSFGEVFLELRRAALARGDGFALTLVAYGDMDWQL